MYDFARFTLARQFLLASFIIFLAGMILIGLLVGREIETGVVNQTGAVTALYVESFIAPYLQDLAAERGISAAGVDALDRLLRDTALGQRVVAFKIWSRDGTVLYSNNHALIGRQFPLDEDLAQAVAGKVQSEISELGKSENEFERTQWPRLIETYAPVRLSRQGSPSAVVEFYQTTDDLDRDVRSAQWRSWLVVAAVAVAMYILLASLVGRASHTIVMQARDLRGKVAELETLLAENRKLGAERLRDAEARIELEKRFQQAKRLESLATMASGAAHDFNNLLTAILGNAEVALLELATDHPICAPIRAIQDAGLMATSLVRQMLDFTGESSVSIGSLRVNRVVAETARLLRVTLPRAIDLRYQFAADLPEVDADTTQMQQVVMNLIKNGADAIGDRPGTITLTTGTISLGDDAQTRWTLDRAVAPGRYVYLDVRDSGCGMTEAVRARIFDPFFTTKADGHGLGLAALMGTVHRHNGAISVETAPSQGTAFRIWLPVGTAWAKNPSLAA
jgi:signal transduction histidine kinase